MTLLLDSCTLIWLACEPGRLSAPAARAINAPENRLAVSHASLWELSLKHGAGKLALPTSPRQWWTEQVAQWSLVQLTLTAEVLFLGIELPPHHKDPFDRVLIAQAKAENLTLVSPDSAFASYGLPLIW